jgi:hypothetical protein
MMNAFCESVNFDAFIAVVLRPARRITPQIRNSSGLPGLGLLVITYLVAMFAGILLLGQLTRTELPHDAAAMVTSQD